MSFFNGNKGSFINQTPNWKLSTYLPAGIAFLSIMIMASPKGPSILNYLFFTPSTVTVWGEWWRILSHPFVIASGGRLGPLSILLIALFLWWVGRPLEEEYGSPVYLTLFFITAIAAALSAIIIHLFAAYGASIFLIGPFAMLFTGTWIYARNNPDHQFYIMFVLPVRAKYAPILFILFRVLTATIDRRADTTQVILIILAESLGGLCGVLLLKMMDKKRGNRKVTAGIAIKKKQEAEDRELEKNAAKSAAPLFKLEDSATVGTLNAADKKLLQSHLDKKFDFEICPLEDFEREDNYCKQCPAFTHCLAKEIKKKSIK